MGQGVKSMFLDNKVNYDNVKTPETGFTNLMSIQQIEALSLGPLWKQL